MKKIIVFIFIASFFIKVQAQDNLQKYLDNALEGYPKINYINWVINYGNSVNINNKHIKLEIIGNNKDTTHFATFHIFPDSNMFVNLIEYATVVNKLCFEEYTSYNSSFRPVYKYKCYKNDPDSLIFEFGRDVFYKNGY